MHLAEFYDADEMNNFTLKIGENFKPKSSFNSNNEKYFCREQIYILKRGVR
jgi:hypothetical protein